jgi:hypothetical protein
MKIIKVCLAILSLLGFGNAAKADGNSVITLDQLNLMFENMRANPGYKKWGIDGSLLWGYFFTDPNPKKLRPVADYLTKNGYRFVSIYPTDDNKTYFLHVERVEHHTPESLNVRNHEFYKLADKYHLESYDGMDVGPVNE